MPPSPTLPAARGLLSSWLLDRLASDPHDVGAAPAPVDDPLAGEDTHLFLYLCYELHYRGLPGIHDSWEWEPSLIAARSVVEDRFLEALHELVGPPVRCGDVGDELRAIIDSAAGPSLSRYLVQQGTLGQLREFHVHRSPYQLKEADPHSWALPRLGGRAKAAMVEIQADEYGGGVEADMHCTLFADTMDALGLDSTYGAYVDVVPGFTLATVNLVSLFGLHRRWRGALVGHLAVFEMTSVAPMGRYAEACDRLGLPASARRFYDVHVAADAHHEVVASTDLAAGFVETDPGRAGDVVFGARALMSLEERLARSLLEAWEARETSLRRALPVRRVSTRSAAA